MILGAILAGGQARRFGSDKALALWRGKALIDHVAERLSPYVAGMVVCGRRHPGIADTEDRPEPGLGPLGGINGALHYAREHGLSWVLTVPCDVPSIGADALHRVAASAGTAYLRDLPVVGLWNVAAAAELDRHLRESDDRSVTSWARRIGAIALDAPVPVNVNFREDIGALDGA